MMLLNQRGIADTLLPTLIFPQNESTAIKPFQLFEANIRLPFPPSVFAHALNFNDMNHKFFLTCTVTARNKASLKLK